MVAAAAAASWPPSANHEAMTAAMHQSSPPSWDIPTLTQQNHHQSTVFSACQNNNWTPHCFMTNGACSESLWEWDFFCPLNRNKRYFYLLCFVDDAPKSSLQDQKAKILNLDFLWNGSNLEFSISCGQAGQQQGSRLEHTKWNIHWGPHKYKSNIAQFWNPGPSTRSVF